jgi:hypothetical protein
VVDISADSSWTRVGLMTTWSSVETDGWLTSSAVESTGSLPCHKQAGGTQGYPSHRAKDGWTCRTRIEQENP